MWWKWLQTHQKDARGWKRDHLTWYILYSQYAVHVFTPKTIYNNECTPTRTYQPPHSWPPCGYPASRSSSAWPGSTDRAAFARPKLSLGRTRAPRAAGLTGPRGRLAGSASVASVWSHCAVWAAAGASCAHPVTWPKRPAARANLRRLARARNDLKLPQPPYRPRPWPPRQHLAAAERRPSGGLNACGGR